MTTDSSRGTIIEHRLNLLAENSMIDGEIWRAAYTKEDAAAKGFVKGWLKEAGLHPYEDAVGNVFGRLEGTDEKEKILLIGSHLDTVKNGGKYDGAAGVVSAISAVENLIKKFGPPKKSLELIAMAEEEGSRYFTGFIGSRAITGTFDASELDMPVNDGIKLREAMASAGCSPDNFKDARKNNIDAFLELHIEQGALLDETKTEIGIVESIVGIILFRVKVTGKQNHAGTTPMAMRKDPFMTSAGAISDLCRKVTGMSETATFTVGNYNVTPGLHNVIPDNVEFTIDLRDGNQEKLDKLVNLVYDQLYKLKDQGFNVEIELECNEKAAKMDRDMVERLFELSEKRFKTVKMNSGAGHDTQVFTEAGIPTAMIFIPSADGISHSPKEYTDSKALDNGCLLMEDFIYDYAW